jgi:hypothetical protein
MECWVWMCRGYCVSVCAGVGVCECNCVEVGVCECRWVMVELEGVVVRVRDGAEERVRVSDKKYRSSVCQAPKSI